MQRAREHLVDRALLDDLPRVHDEDVVGDVARAREIVRDVEERDIELSSRSRIRLRIPMRIETSSIEIGSSAITTLGFAASARAIATRWRCPPDSSCGYLSAIARAGTRPTRLEQRRPRFASTSAPATTVDPQRPLEVRTHRLRRVQRAERILEDHLHLRAVAENAARRRSRATSRPLEEHLAAVGGSRRRSRRATVLLPLPLSPASAVIRPGRSAKRHVVDRVQAGRPAGRRPTGTASRARVPRGSRRHAHA